MDLLKFVFAMLGYRLEQAQFLSSFKANCLGSVRESKLVSCHNQEKGFPIAFPFHMALRIFFLRKASMHKVEQSECSAGNQSQRRHALQTEEETSSHKDRVTRKSTIHTVWRPHLNIIRELINARLLQNFHFSFISSDKWGRLQSGSSPI